ncbi:MBL fold metallo-hydrolase [Flagellimonas sp. CMM7]|uniref:MBL fold metallo-hydrolase n=1 Tax=Flagellimonas sp. CMM7 TaxID=2654676 RepID=UPI0013D300CF|nr:MBL fold metallo-hydrolase [Flagellimonas sp. CMM7]UII81418.1 MBL fold metallo-hydrolase [Flagellimonas sp. CMM7]
MKTIGALAFVVLLFYGCTSELKESEILKRIEEHYTNDKNSKGITISYERINFNPYQSFDFRSPDSLTSKNTITISDNSFFAERWVFFPGGFNFGLKEFQQNSLGYLYDLNGILMGKRAIPQDKERINEVRDELEKIIDYKFSQSLFSEQNKILLDSLDLKNNSVSLIKINDAKDSLWITFQINPIALKSVISHSKKEKWVFSSFTENDGIVFLEDIDYYKNGTLKHIYSIKNISEIESMPEKELSIPDGITIYETITKEPEIQEIAPDLYLITPIAEDRNVLFTINRDNITVFGAPLSDRFSNQVIELIKNNFPDKNIESVYVTHAHSDHIGGLGAYVKIGASILTDSFSIETIKSFPRFKGQIDSFVFEPIKNREKRGSNTQFFVIDNSHCKSQGFVYFKNGQTIYQGDFLEIPEDNTLPTYLPLTTLEFYDFVNKEKLSIKRIIAHHRNNHITMETFKNYYSKFN